jgi:hypothetical protein
LLWLKALWLDEYDSGLGPPLVLHVRGRTAKSAAPFVERAGRIFDGRYILWAVERDLHAPPAKGHSLPVKVDANGRVLRRQVEWLLVAHEAVKRIAPNVTDETRLSREEMNDRHHRRQRAWLLRSWLNARGYSDEWLIFRLSRLSGWPVERVPRAIERAGREGLAELGERAGPQPLDTSASLVPDASRGLAYAVGGRRDHMRRPRAGHVGVEGS